MPIANCYLGPAQKSISAKKAEKIASAWAKEVGVDRGDVCLSFVKISVQAGRHYEIMVNLFLPSMWTKKQVEAIQNSLLRLLSEQLGISPAGIFIITMIVQSGHVMENGQVVNW